MITRRDCGRPGPTDQPLGCRIWFWRATTERQPEVRRGGGRRAFGRETGGDGLSRPPEIATMPATGFRKSGWPCRVLAADWRVHRVHRWRALQRSSRPGATPKPPPRVPQTAPQPPEQSYGRFPLGATTQIIKRKRRFSAFFSSHRMVRKTPPQTSGNTSSRCNNGGNMP